MTVASETRMFPWAAKHGPEIPPAQSMHSPPVYVALPPSASTMPSWRWSRPSSAPVRRPTTSAAERPSASSARPSGP